MDELVLFYPVGHQNHRKPGHPERPERVEVIWSAFQKAGWWTKVRQIEPLQIPTGVLESVHTHAYLNLLELSCRRSGQLDADTYTTPRSWELAHHAGGGALAVAEAVWQGTARRGFALCRPPGHHAMRWRRASRTPGSPATRLPVQRTTWGRSDLTSASRRSSLTLPGVQLAVTPEGRLC